MTKKTIAVIGAGISGLTCAYELQKAGFEVTVYEKENQVGGRMRSRKKDGLMFDIGATHLIPLYTHMMEYIREFNIGWEQMDFEQYGMLATHRLSGRTIRSIDKNLGWRSNMRLAKLFLSIKDDGRNTFDFNEWTAEDTESAYDYLTSAAGRRVADYIGDAFTAAYQFHRSTEISSGALQSMIQSIKRERDKWYLHHMSRGMSALPDAFAQRLNVHTGVSVEKVEHTDDGVHVTLPGGEVKAFDAVVMATTANITSKLLTSATLEQRNFLNNIDYAATVSLAYRVKADSLPQFSITWIPYAEDKHFSGISNEVMKGDDLRNDNNESLLCTWLHDGYARELIDKPDEEILRAAREKFVDMCPWIESEDQLTPHDLQRWTDAMPKFAPGTLKAAKTFLEENQGNNNTFFCGDYLNAPWTEGALQCGQRVAKSVIQQYSA